MGTRYRRLIPTSQLWLQVLQAVQLLQVQGTGETRALCPCPGRASSPHSPLSWASSHLPSPLLGRILGWHGPAGHSTLW